MKIFIVEDEEEIRSELAALLQKYGYLCEAGTDFAQIPQQIVKAEANLVLLDINLPCQDGYTICREIRKQSDIPIIVLTGRDTDFDELMSLHIGADDFIAKPYHAQILIARIEKLLKRTYEAQAHYLLRHKGLTLNLSRATASYLDKETDLTKNELGILRLLMANKGNVIPRDALIDELWQSGEFVDENTLNVNMVRLRRKLSDIGAPDYIETKRGLGYLI